MHRHYNSYKIVESKWWENMINYTSRPIILPNMKAIRPTNSEELHSQSEAGPMNKLTYKQMDKSKNYIWGIKINATCFHLWQDKCIPTTTAAYWYCSVSNTWYYFSFRTWFISNLILIVIFKIPMGLVI